MARGWESKSVESQIEDRNAAREEPSASRDDRRRDGLGDDVEHLRQIEGMEMSRRRVTRELETSHSPVHRNALENALKHLDAELKKLKK